MKTNKLGFSPIKTILSLVIAAAIIGGGGYYLWHSGGSANKLDNNSATAELKSGIKGHTYIVTTGGAAPVKGEPLRSKEAYPEKFAIENSKTYQTITTITSDKQGYFSFDVEPGTYLIAPKAQPPVAPAETQMVTVSTNKYSDVSIEYNFPLP